MQHDASCTECINCNKDKADRTRTDPEDVEGTDEGDSMLVLPDPYPKTVTGVIRIMRAAGRNTAAEFMEEIKETTQQAERLLASLQALHRKKTGRYPTVPKRKTSES